MWFRVRVRARVCLRVCVCQDYVALFFYYLTSLITTLQASRVYYYSIIDITINAIV